MLPLPVPRPSAVVFDLGGVLIDWDPRYLYRHLIDDPDEIEAFLDEVGFAQWNGQQDAGRPWTVAVEELTARYPHRRALIEAFHARWPESLGDAIAGTVDALADLRATGVRLLALTNWSAETFPFAAARYPFLAWFEAVLVSGAVGIAKPDPRIFALLTERYGLTPEETLYIDDSAANVAAATRLGFRAVLFTEPDALRDELVRLELLSADPGV